MSTFDKTIPNGGYVKWPGGASFQILSASVNVDVEFTLQGRRVNLAKNVPASYYYRPGAEKLDQSGNAFDEVKITAAYGDSTIHVDISDSESGTNILSGSVGVTTMPAVTLAEPNPQKYFGSASATLTKVSGFAGVTTVLAPGANTNGAIIYAADSYEGGAAVAGASVLLGSSAPTTQFDGLAVANCYRSSSSNAFYQNGVNSAMPLFVPAGYGVYIYTGATSGNASVLLEVL